MDSQLDRIEAKLDKVLELLEGMKRPKPVRRSVKADYDADFERLWTHYPKRAGSNPKASAYRAFCARLKEGVALEDMHKGIMQYGAFCKATGILGTGYVMQAVRFLGVNREFENGWEVPKVPAAPRTDEEWIHHGKALGMEAWPGETMHDYKQRLMGARV